MATIVGRADACDVYIGRPRRGQPWNWGNPFEIGCDGTRDEVCDKFAIWYEYSADDRAIWMREHIHELKGKRLGCFCKPQRCHGDFLAKKAEET